MESWCVDHCDFYPTNYVLGCCSLGDPPEWCLTKICNDVRKNVES